MSIPLLWEEVVWLPAWGQYRGRDVAGHVTAGPRDLPTFATAIKQAKDLLTPADMEG